MGQTIRTLSAKPLKPDVIFGSRFVVELCETVHVHYRNLRIVMGIGGFHKLALGFSNALRRWTDRGAPEPGQGKHIELCRTVPEPVGDDMVRINLNKNLYSKFDGKIFSEGANLPDDEYVHVKIRDLRLEMTKDDFFVIADAFTEAKHNLVASESRLGAPEA